MRFTQVAILGAFLAVIPVLSTAQKGKNPPPQPPKPKIPKMIYISDFDIDFVTPEETPKAESAQAGPPKGSAPLVPAHQAKLSADHPPKWNDPAARAQHIIGLMATGVVDGISERHLPARRLFAGDPMPTEGLLIRGVFVETASKHFRRAALGSAPMPGAQMLLLITFTDLALPDQPLYHFAKDDGSFPGPGALIALNPRLTLIKFDMDRSLSDKVVSKTASQVAKEISIRINPPPPD